jgi:hypothetical protein
MHDLEPYEMQSALFVLGYTDDLVDEGEIAAALEALTIDGQSVA